MDTQYNVTSTLPQNPPSYAEATAGDNTPIKSQQSAPQGRFTGQTGARNVVINDAHINSNGDINIGAYANGGQSSSLVINGGSMSSTGDICITSTSRNGSSSMVINGGTFTSNGDFNFFSGN